MVTTLCATGRIDGEQLSDLDLLKKASIGNCQLPSSIGENPPYGMIGRIEETSASFEARSAPRSYPTEPHRPRVMRRCPRGHRRSVDRGAHRPAIEPR